MTGIDNTWPVGLDRLAVDPATSTVVARSDFADWPLLAKLSKLGVQAHMGVLFGMVNQILLAALAIGLLCVIVWGYRMWWQRRPTRTGRARPGRDRRRLAARGSACPPGPSSSACRSSSRSAGRCRCSASRSPSSWWSTR